MPGTDDRCRFPDFSKLTGAEELEEVLSKIENREDRLRVVAKLMWLLRREENIEKKEAGKGENT